MYILQNVRGKNLFSWSAFVSCSSKVRMFLFMFIKFRLKIEFFCACLTSKFFSLQKFIFAMIFISSYIILMHNCCKTFRAHEMVPFLHNRFYWWCSITFFESNWHFRCILYSNVCRQPLLGQRNPITSKSKIIF